MEAVDMIYTDSQYNELGYLSDRCELDMEIGSVVSADSTNDFQITCPIDELPEGLEDGSIVYALGTEIGGIVTGFGADTEQSRAYIYGMSWRGKIYQEIIEPPEGEAYLKVSGEANGVLSQLIDTRFEGLIIASSDDSGISVSRDFRYVNLLKGIEQMLSLSDARMQIRTVRNENDSVQAVVEAVPIDNLSADVQFDNDYNVTMIAKKNRCGVTEVICLGEGELLERTVIHLYRDENGEITQDSSKRITGLRANAITYDYGSVESEDELISGGMDRFDEECDEESLEISVGDEVEIGDIISVREQITGIEMQKPISQKIYKGYMNRMDVEYKVGE